jgi:hypothetical protein
LAFLFFLPWDGFDHRSFVGFLFRYTRAY